MSITPYPTLSQRMQALHAHMMALAKELSDEGDYMAAGCVQSGAASIKNELDAFRRDVEAAITAVGADSKTIMETDLFAGHYECTVVKSFPLPPPVCPPIPHGTWGWLTLQGQTIRCRAYSSTEGGKPVYIDGDGKHWDMNAVSHFEPDGPSLHDQVDYWRDLWNKQTAERAILGTQLEKANRKISAYQATIDMLTEKVGKLKNEWQPASTAPKEFTQCIAFYRGANRATSGYIEDGRFFPDSLHGSAPFTDWIPMPTTFQSPSYEQKNIPEEKPGPGR